MTNTITEPTRTTNCSMSLIDLILTSNPERFALSGTMKVGLNDHDLIYTIRKQKIARPPPKVIEYRSMKGFDKDCYVADLGKIPWDSAYIYDDTDDIYEHWHRLFITVPLLISICLSKRNTSEAINCPGLLPKSLLQSPGVTYFSANLREMQLMTT